MYKGEQSRSGTTDKCLPPCRVCLRRGSGFHYGAITCDACKGFFRRSHRVSQSLVCVQNSTCSVEMYVGIACPRCRYQKCLHVGMSETAIKRGRYTVKRRTDYILEVTEQQQNSNETLAKQITLPPAINDTCSAVNHGDLLQTLLTAHAQCVPSLHYITEVNHCQIMCSQSTFSNQDSFLDFLNSELDSPGSHQDTIQQEIILEMESKIHPYVNFLKAIPGFTSLSSNDKIQISKHGRFDFYLLEEYPGHSRELNLITPSTNTCFHVNDLCHLWGDTFTMDLMSLAQQLQSLNLSLSELVLVEAICLLSSDRCGLEDRDGVERLQWRLVTCLLQHHTHIGHTSQHRFSKIMDRVARMRVLAERNAVIVKDMCKSPYMQGKPLLFELLNL